MGRLLGLKVGNSIVIPQGHSDRKSFWHDHFVPARFVVALFGVSHFVAGPFWSGTFWREFHENNSFFCFF